MSSTTTARIQNESILEVNLTSISVIVTEVQEGQRIAKTLPSLNTQERATIRHDSILDTRVKDRATGWRISYTLIYLSSRSEERRANRFHKAPHSYLITIKQWSNYFQNRYQTETNKVREAVAWYSFHQQTRARRENVPTRRIKVHSRDKSFLGTSWEDKDDDYSTTTSYWHNSSN